MAQCTVTVDRDIDASEDGVIWRRVGKVFEAEQGIITGSFILESTEDDELTNTLDRIRTYETTDDVKVSSLLNDILEEGKRLYLVAAPAFQDFSISISDESDVLYFRSDMNELTLRLTNDSYQTCPSFTASDGRITVQKMKQTKRGHGSGRQASVNYLIKIILDPVSRLPDKIKYIMDKVFTKCKIRIYSFDYESSFHKELSKHFYRVDVTTGSKELLIPLPTRVDEELFVYYEYLTLLHTDVKQVFSKHENFANSYELPPNIDQTGIATKKVNLKNFDSAALKDIYTTLKWLSISLNTAKLHVLLYRCPEAILCWACHSS